MQKILIVDDDPEMYRLYERTFLMEGFSVEVAEDGEEGLDKARSFDPDVILLDIMMKKVNGLETLSSLKADAVAHDIPVVVLSNVSDMGIMNQAKSKGAAQYVIKSETEPAAMVSLVKDVLSNTGAAGAGYM